MLLLVAGLLFNLATGCDNEDESPDPVTDIEGNSYKTVRIGDQIWMAENLKTSSLSDGTEIPDVPDAIDWNELTTPGRCWYNNDEETHKNIYGALYNGYTINSGKLCPTGWHVPAREEWEELRGYLGDTIIAGGKLKEAGTLHWLAPNKGADNSSGFTALPAGIRYLNGSFSSILHFTSFWSSTYDGNVVGWHLSLYYNDAVAVMSKITKKNGFSIRCVKD